MTRLDTPKVVTVFAATGHQGGSVVRSLVQNQKNNFKVRAVTRNPSSKAAQTLRALGADIVHADGWKVEEIAVAFQGSWAAFVNTNSDDEIFLNENGPTEFDLGKTIIDGLAAANVKHLVYSSFVSSKQVSDGKFVVNGMEMKNQIENYALECKAFETVSAVHAGWYFEYLTFPPLAQMFSGFPLHTDEDGYMTLSAPRWGREENIGIPWLCVEKDFGDIVHGMLLSPENFHGKAVPATSDVLSFPDLTAAFQKATGRKSRYLEFTPWEAFGAGIPSFDDHRLLFGFGQYTDGKYFGNELVHTAKSQALKVEAAKAQMKENPESALLTTAVEWFEKSFSSQE